jgi:hypothetical protein
VLLVYLVCRKFLGIGAVLVALLYGINPTTAHFVGQPVLETVMLTGVLGTIYLSLRESNWAYLTAFFTALIRYDAALVIGAIATKGLLNRQSRLKTVINSIFASLGVIGWLALSVTQYKAKINPYVQQIRLGFGEPRFIKNCVRIIVDILPQNIVNLIPFKLLTVALGCLMMIGLFRFVTKEKKRSLEIVAFFILYGLLHSVYPSVNAPLRYALPILWIFYLLIVIGSGWIVSLVTKQQVPNGITYPISMQKLNRHYMLLAFSGLWIFSVAMLWLRGSEYRSMIVPFVLCSVVIIAYIASVMERHKTLSVVTSCILIIILASGLIEAKTGWNSRWKYYRSDQREMCEWYQKVAMPGDKMAVSEVTIMSYYANLDNSYFVELGQIEYNKLEDLNVVLAEKNIKYIVLDRHKLHYHGKGYDKVEKRFATEILYYLESNANNSNFVKVAEFFRPGLKRASSIVYRVRDREGL